MAAKKSGDNGVQQVDALDASNSAVKQVDAALDEIDAAAEAATNALAEHDGTAVADDGESLISSATKANEPNESRQPRPKLPPEERRRLAIAKANRQRKLGEKALVKEFVGSVSLSYDVVINDIVIAASFVRFTHLIDQALYTLARYGSNAFSRSEINQVFDQFQKIIEVYADDAKSSFEASSERLQQAKDSLLSADDWMQPQYQKHAQQITMQVKHRLTKRFVDAMIKYDEAIYNVTVLEWNDAADQAEASRLRENERRQSRIVFYLAARTLLGLRKKTFEGLLEKRESQKGQKQASDLSSTGEPHTAVDNSNAGHNMASVV